MTARARTVFLGSGSFAIPVVARLATLSSVDLAAIVSAPARPRGRGGRVQSSPVGEWAAATGLVILAPPRLREPEAVAAIRDLAPELLLLADYGQIVPAELLELPTHGALNLHPSLLPRHRGASPIPAAILAGDRETGVSLMRMDAGLDTGPIIAQQRLPLDGTEIAPELERRLAEVAAGLLADNLDPWLAGELAARAQPDEGATLTRPLSRRDGRLDPALPAEILERQVRAYQPWPGSFLETAEGRLIVWRARAIPGMPDSARGRPQPGRLVALGSLERAMGLGLVTADGLLELLEVQPAGGRRMSAAELLRGRPTVIGSDAGTPSQPAP